MDQIYLQKMMGVRAVQGSRGEIGILYAEPATQRMVDEQAILPFSRWFRHRRRTRFCHPRRSIRRTCYNDIPFLEGAKVYIPSILFSDRSIHTNRISAGLNSGAETGADRKPCDLNVVWGDDHLASLFLVFGCVLEYLQLYHNGA